MAVVKVSDLAYTRLQVPDLELAEQFLTDFGLVLVRREGDSIFFRGTDAAAYCYELQRGPARFLGFAFNASNRTDLDTLAGRFGMSVEPIPGPGGGVRVRLQEPNGYDVDVVFGVASGPPLEVSRQVLNTGGHPLRRAGELFRLKKGEATPVKRLAHVVLGSPRVRETVDWFNETLGMISSDDLVAGPAQDTIGSFIRIDKGEDYVDHHTIFVITSPVAGLHHISFEVQDTDAVFADHHHLKSLGKYEHLWGIGRHLLGSQIFDYWADPFGYIHEHWSDTDRLNALAPTNIWDAREGMVTQWGEPAPERVRHGARP